MKDIIDAIYKKHQRQGIVVHPPATEAQIAAFEQQQGFALPDDFRLFYKTCNGFECNEDIFNMSSLADINKYGRNDISNSFYFAEYMANSDLWGMRLLKDGTYRIFKYAEPEFVLTNYLEVFLHRFLSGSVFEPEGLYDWQEKLQQERGINNNPKSEF